MLPLDRSLRFWVCFAGRRRPQTAADRAVEAEVRKLQGGAIDLPLVRLAAVTPWGEQVILAPVRASPNDTLGMFDADPKGTPAGGVSCGCGITPAFIEGGRGWSLEGAGRNFAGGSTGFRLFIVVPDGVAKVTFVLPRQRVHSSAPGRPVDRYPLAVSAPVHDNVAFVQVLNRACCDGSFVTRWYAADGRLIEVAGSRSGANRIVAPPAPARTHRASPVILRTFGVLRIRRASPSPAHHFRQSVG